MLHTDRHHPPTFILGGSLDRALHDLRAAVAAAPVAHWAIEADGSDLSGDYIGLEAMNIRSVGPNLPLAPDADPGDGALDLVLVRASDRERLGERLRTAEAGALSPGRFGLDTYRCTDLRLVPPPDVNIHVDSELWLSEDLPEGVELRVRHAGSSMIVAPTPRRPEWLHDRWNVPARNGGRASGARVRGSDRTSSWTNAMFAR